MSDTTYAWYFSAYDCALSYGDGRPIELGVTHQHDGEPRLGYSGLHASYHALDALQHAPGPVLWKVACDGYVDYGPDNLACTSRTYIAGGIDASFMLQAFVRWGGTTLRPPVGLP